MSCGTSRHGVDKKNLAQNFPARHLHLAIERILFHRCFERSFMVELRAAPLPSAARDKSNQEEVP